jgi:hypothetical protein
MSSKTITFIRTHIVEVSFDDWYENKEDDFKCVCDAVKQWDAMVDGTDNGEYRIDDEDLEYDDVEGNLDELEDENKIETEEEKEAARLKKIADDLAAQKAKEAAEALKAAEKVRKIEELKKQLAELEA